MQSQTKTIETTTSTVTQTSRLEFGDSDDTFPYRLVGSYEYGTALTQLGDLVDSSTSEQIDVYDKLIQSRPEYSFHSGVVLELGLDAQLNSPSSGESEEMTEKFLKHSLAWMMALARVELGATMSMYGTSDDPFGDAVVVGGRDFGADEYLSILLDDLAAHLKAAQIDSEYQKGLSLKEKVDASSLADLRRTHLINDMLLKVISSGDSDIISAAGPYAETSQKAIDQLIAKITIATTSFTSETTPSTTSSTRESSRLTGVRFDNRENLRGCQRALERQLGPPDVASSPLQ